MAGLLEADVFACVHVQQVAGARPLVAVRRLPRRTGRPRKPGPFEHLPDGGMCEAGSERDQARSPAGVAPASADPLSELRRELTRRAMRPARAIEQTPKRCTRFLTRLQPAVRPTVRSRRRPAEGVRGRL